jgi:DNA end-binding protein Ku
VGRAAARPELTTDPDRRRRRIAVPARRRPARRQRPARRRRPKTGEAAKTGASGTRTRGAASPAGLDGLSKDELYGRAKELDIPGRSAMSKDELIAAIARNS